MAFGLQINNSEGNNVYDTSSTAWFQIVQFDVPAKPASSTNDETQVFWTDIGFDPTGFELLIQIQMVDVPPDAQEGYAPKATVNIVRAEVDQIGNSSIGFQASERVIAIVLAKGTGA